MVSTPPQIEGPPLWMFLTPSHNILELLDILDQDMEFCVKLEFDTNLHSSIV